EMLLLLQQLRLHSPAHGDVTCDQREEVAPAGIEAVAADLDIEEAAVAAALPGLDDEPGARLPQLREQRLGRAAVIAEDLRERDLLQLLQGISEVALHGGIGVDDVERLAIDDQH